MGIENELAAAIILARELANHQRTGARGSFPVDVARAVRGKVIAQGVEILAAAFVVTFESSLQAGKDLKVFRGWLHGRINKRLRFQIKLARFSQKAKRKAGNGAEC